MNKKTKLYAGILLVALVLGVGMILSAPDPVVVQVREVAPGVVESTVANTRAGTVEACRRARMAPIVGGQVA